MDKLTLAEQNFDYYSERFGLSEQDKKALLSAFKRIGASMNEAFSAMNSVLSFAKFSAKDFQRASIKLNKPEPEKQTYKQSQANK